MNTLRLSHHVTRYRVSLAHVLIVNDGFLVLQLDIARVFSHLLPCNLNARSLARCVPPCQLLYEYGHRRTGTGTIRHRDQASSFVPLAYSSRVLPEVVCPNSQAAGSSFAARRLAQEAKAVGLISRFEYVILTDLPDKALW